MSKRKLGISYSSLGRQVRTQVDADLRLIGNLHRPNEVSSDESGDDPDLTYPTVHDFHVDSQCKPVGVHGDCDQDIENASTSQCNFSQIHGNSRVQTLIA